MGEAINLANNFKVEKVIFNCRPYNDLETLLNDVKTKFIDSRKNEIDSSLNYKTYIYKYNKPIINVLFFINFLFVLFFFETINPGSFSLFIKTQEKIDI